MKRRKPILAIAAALAVVFLAASLHSVEIKKGTAPVSNSYGDDLAISVRVVGGNGSVLKPGERVKLTFQTNRDAYVVLYNIDSEGYVTLLYPDDGKPKRIEGQKVYFLPEVGSGLFWTAEGETGIEYIHAVAVSDRDALREEELYFLANNGDRREDERFKIDGDPFLSFNMIDEEIIANAIDNPPATDYTYFYINRKVDYPRYLCSKCHAPGKLSDPYNMDCPEVVVERFSYESDVRYPYPPLFDVTYVDDIDDRDYYSSSAYVDKHFETDYEQDDERPIYLSIYYSNHSYPYRYYWPSYQTFWTSYHYDPFWWDFYWYWDFGYAFSFTDYYYHYWPFYTWYYPYSWYWIYDHDYYWRHYDYCSYPSYRPLCADRTLVKRTLNYTATSTELTRDRILSSSQLQRERSATYARRVDDANASARTNRARTDISRLADQNARRTIVRRSDYRNLTSSTDRLDASKRIVHGRDSSRGALQRLRERTVPERSSGARRETDGRSNSPADRTGTSRTRSDDGRNERSTRSRDKSTEQTGGATTRSSQTDKRRTRSSSGRSDAVKKSDANRESTSSSRSRSPSSRAVNRSSGSSRSSGDTSSSGSSGSSRSSRSRRK
jgi:hypothetical protein